MLFFRSKLFSWKGYTGYSDIVFNSFVICFVLFSLGKFIYYFLIWINSLWLISFDFPFNSILNFSTLVIEQFSFWFFLGVLLLEHGDEKKWRLAKKNYFLSVGILKFWKKKSRSFGGFGQSKWWHVWYWLKMCGNIMRETFLLNFSLSIFPRITSPGISMKTMDKCDFWWFKN